MGRSLCRTSSSFNSTATHAGSYKNIYLKFKHTIALLFSSNPCSALHSVGLSRPVASLHLAASCSYYGFRESEPLMLIKKRTSIIMGWGADSLETPIAVSSEGQMPVAENGSNWLEMIVRRD